MLAALAGGCLAPVGGWAHPGPDGQLRLDAVVLSADGQRRIAAGATATWGTVAWDTATDGDAVRLGRDVADKLLAQGAAELIRQSREGMGEV
jgi:hydroxymethylbilane synthase